MTTHFEVGQRVQIWSEDLKALRGTANIAAVDESRSVITVEAMPDGAQLGDRIVVSNAIGRPTHIPGLERR